ncbi:uncharacterized protein LOC105435175 [Cucumis sativus]|uniref:Transmembrane protein n=1 Tax=Cucumis sativus TaxID=3659 RepID=A0A0A0KZ80_CUCSA|nr:uncharacterized protein LOC105435175 [Cucumis sativus]KGN53176.1 hypothetical protein Csa_015195 [Cucumis sativus]
MYRSVSWNRFSDEYYSHSAPSSKPGQSLRLSSSFDHGNNELPTNDPVSEMVKREKARVKFAETAVHVIPFVLLICAIVLWFFSNPDVEMRGATTTGIIRSLTLEGEFESTQTEALPTFDGPFSDASRLHDTIFI